MSVRMRVTRSHTGNRRSHHGIKAPRLSKCADCSEMHIRHHLCENCGKYRGRAIVDVALKIEKKEKKQKEKMAALGASSGGKQEKDLKQEEDVASKEASEKPLDAADLSKR